MPGTSLRTFLDKNLRSIMKNFGATDNELSKYDLTDASIYEPVPDTADPFAVYFLRALALYTSQDKQPIIMNDDLSVWRQQLSGKSRDRRLEDSLADLGFSGVIWSLPGTRGGGVKANLGRIFKEHNISAIAPSYIEKIYFDLYTVEQLLFQNDERATPIPIAYFPLMFDAFPENVFSKAIQERIFNALLPRIKEIDDFMLLNELFGRLDETHRQQLVEKINLKQCLLKNRVHDISEADMENRIRVFVKFFNIKAVPVAEKAEYFFNIVTALVDATRSQQQYAMTFRLIQGCSISSAYKEVMESIIYKYTTIQNALKQFANNISNSDNIVWNLAKSKDSAEEIIQDINAYQKTIEAPLVNPLNRLWSLGASSAPSTPMPPIAEDKKLRGDLIRQLFKK